MLDGLRLVAMWICVVLALAAAACDYGWLLAAALCVNGGLCLWHLAAGLREDSKHLTEK